MEEKALIADGLTIWISSGNFVSISLLISISYPLCNKHLSATTFVLLLAEMRIFGRNLLAYLYVITFLFTYVSILK